MDKNAAKRIIQETLQNPFDKIRFRNFAVNLLNHVDENKAFHARGHVKEMFKQQAGIIKTYERIGTYTDPEGKKLDILVVYLEKTGTIDKARTTLRNFAAHYLKQRDEKDAGLFAFVSPNLDDWRFSFVKMEYNLQEVKGKIRAKEEFTPAKRYSFLVGKNESSHTAQNQFVSLLEEDDHNPTLAEIEAKFNIEVITKEFFTKYRELFLDVKDALEKVVEQDPKIKEEFLTKFVDTTDFAKKLLGQIVFLYFLQKKGWFGVERDLEWGTGPKNFLRLLYHKQYCDYKNFFNDVLEPLFYNALAIERPHDWSDRFNCKIPFLNGGLFDPLRNYDWVHTDIELPNDLFHNEIKTKEGDIGTGILDMFDRYNFTVKEDEPLEKEVAVDPEMLGKVFENLLEVKDRKSKGTYYTPREIVHYMCEQSLINYLATGLEGKVSKEDLEQLIKFGEDVAENEATYVAKKEDDPDYVGLYKRILPASIGEYAQEIDEKLAAVKVCDLAIGSGAFPVGMMSEIVKARGVLSSYIKDRSRTVYGFKRDCIQNSLYGVDIDPGAVEIAKLRLWLSLIVDEEDIKEIKPLPNLDYKIMQGNSLLEEFEGIKLFDEKLLRLDSGVDKKKLEELKSKESEFSSKLLSFYQKNPSWMKDKKLNRPVKLYELEQEMDRVKSAIKDLGKINNAESTSQRQEGFKFKGAPGADEIWDELNLLHKKFFNVAQKNTKDELKKRISTLEWELIEATLKEQGKVSELKKLEEFKKSNTRPFFLWKLHFAEVFQEKGGFDITIANPPYVRQEEINYKAGLKGAFKIFNAVSDLYTYFYEKGVSLLKNQGVLSYITSNKFTRAQYGKNLRKYLKENSSLKNIINFREKHVFDAVTNTLILITTKEKSSNNQFYYSDALENPQSVLFSQDELKDSEWTIENSDIIELKKKIENYGTPLERWNVKINYGIKTGYNEAFLINEEVKTKLIRKDLKSTEIIKPIIRGRDIKRYCYLNSKLYLIVTHNGYKTSENKIIDAINVNKFPAVKNHLNGYIDKLSEREDKGNTIYNLRDCAFMDDFKHEKIIWLELTNTSKFAYSEEEDYLLAGAFFMTGDSLKYLLAFLNSKLCYFYFSLVSNSSGMATMQWKKFAVEKIPAIKPTKEQEKLFIQLVDKILAITKSEDYFGNAGKQARVKDLEHQIDELVYNLYGLTKGEIKIVEAK